MEANYQGSSGQRVMEICASRELGFTRPINFTRRISASQALVERIGLNDRLDGHEGCVNALEFNFTGDLLVSGSDDRQVKLWNWATKSLKFSYSSGHVDNIFQIRIMSFNEDRKIVTSAADGADSDDASSEDGALGNSRDCNVS